MERKGQYKRNIDQDQPNVFRHVKDGEDSP